MSTELPRRQRATGTRAKICIVASEYNEQYTQALVENCSEELKTVLPSVRLEIIRVPGAFEIPVAIKSVLSRVSIHALMRVRRGTPTSTTTKTMFQSTHS